MEKGKEDISKVSSGRKGKGKNKGTKRWRFMQDVEDFVGNSNKKSKDS